MTTRSTELQEICTHLLSPRDSLRTTAESSYLKWRTDDPHSLLLCIRSILRSTDAPYVRSVCVILLRSLLIKDSTAVDYSSPQMVQAVKLVCSELIVSISHETDQLVRHHLNQVVTELGAKLIPKEQWNELIPFLHLNFKSQSDPKKQSMLVIMAELSRYLNHEFSPFHGLLTDLLANGVTDNCLQVRVAAYLSVLTFMHTLIFKGNEIDLMDKLITLIFGNLGAVLQSNDHPSIQTALKRLISISREGPTFFEDSELQLILSFCKNTTNPDSKALATALLVDIAENNGLIIAGFSEYLLPYAMNLLEVGFSNEEWPPSIAASDLGNVERCYGFHILELITKYGHRNEISVIIDKFINAHTESRLYSCFIAASIAITGVEDIQPMESHISRILSNQTTHPETCWAALELAAAVSRQVAQNGGCSELVIFILAMLYDTNSRVSGYAEYLLKKFPDEQVMAVGSEIVENLILKLKKNYNYSTLSYLIYLLHTDQELFSKYTSEVAAITSLSIGLESKLEEVPKIIAKKIMDSLTERTSLDTIAGVLSSCVPILQDDFTPYISSVLSTLFQYCCLPEDSFTLSYATPLEESRDYMVTSNGTITEFEVTEDTTESVKWIGYVVEHAGLQAAKYIDDIFHVLLPVVRSCRWDVALEIGRVFYALIKCAKKHSEAAARKTFEAVFTALIVRMEAGPAIFSMAMVMQKCISKGKDWLSEDQMEMVRDLGLAICSRGIPFYMMAILIVVAEVAKHNVAFYPHVQAFIPIVLQLMQPGASLEEKNIALSLVDYAIEGGGPQAAALFPTVMPYYSAHIQNETASIRQAVVYGVGVFAKAAPEMFEPYREDCLKKLLHTDVDEGVNLYGSLCDFIEKYQSLIIPDLKHYKHLKKVVEDVSASKVKRRVRERLEAVFQTLTVPAPTPSSEATKKTKSKKKSK